jgi:hypothetical protein
MFALVTAVLAGCGDGGGYDELNLVEVTGKVTLDGSPLARARVRFEGMDGLSAEAITDSNGAYGLMYDSEHAGCPPGQKTVRITTADADVEGADPDAPTTGERVPATYNRQSTLRADVSAADKSFDFALKSQP